MTEHFTSEEAVALASTIVEDDDYEFNLVNAAIDAKQKEWEALGAVADAAWNLLDEVDEVRTARTRREEDWGKLNAADDALRVALTQSQAARVPEQAEPEWNDENVIAYCIARGISAAKAFTTGATHPQATVPAPSTDKTKEYSMRDWFNDLDNPHANR